MKICISKKKDGTWCTHKAKYGHHCGYHHPDGYHKSPKIQHESHNNEPKHDNNINDRMFGIEHMLQTLINLHNELMVHFDVVASDVTCNSHKLNDLRRTLQPILGPLRVAVNTVSWMPIVGRFVT